MRNITNKMKTKQNYVYISSFIILLFLVSGCKNLETLINFDGFFETSDGWEVDLNSSGESGSAKITKVGSYRPDFYGMSVGSSIISNIKRTGDNTWSAEVLDQTFAQTNTLVSGNVQIEENTLKISPDNGTPYELSRNSSETTDSNPSKIIGIWVRNDGSTYLKIEGSVATTCNSGTETVGSFNSAVPSMTFVVGGVTYVFKMRMQGDNLIVIVPPQSTNPNHVDTEYVKSTTWPCSGGGDTGGTGTPPKTGFFSVKVYSPVGSCATSVGGGYYGTLIGYYYHTGTKKYHSSILAGPGSGTTGQNDSQGHYYYSLYNHVDPITQGGQNKLYKIEWNFYPNKSNNSSSCVRSGSATIDSEGQTKKVVITW
jgi:hypothetical protein